MEKSNHTSKFSGNLFLCWLYSSFSFIFSFNYAGSLILWKIGFDPAFLLMLARLTWPPLSWDSRFPCLSWLLRLLCRKWLTLKVSMFLFFSTLVMRLFEQLMFTYQIEHIRLWLLSMLRHARWFILQLWIFPETEQICIQMISRCKGVNKM